jgi:hypothetical protein
LPRPLVEDADDAAVRQRSNRTAGSQEKLRPVDARAPLDQIASQQAHRPIVEGQDKNRACLGLLDTEGSSGPVDRTQRERETTSQGRKP